MKTRFLILVGIIVFSTFVAMFVGSIVAGHVFSIVWVDSGGPIGCMNPAEIHNCNESKEYFHNHFWFSQIGFFSPLFIGVGIILKIWKKT